MNKKLKQVSEALDRTDDMAIDGSLVHEIVAELTSATRLLLEIVDDAQKPSPKPSPRKSGVDTKP
ncbi:hypothetical protein [Candidatus Poriferisodalis sp.]|uniref:hypothetical protein n=1 Tax=Candidatus Poriferisodalis sp. TaxID=3101277 RepID=UPI003B01825C